LGRHRVSARASASQDFICHALFRANRIGRAIEWCEELSRIRQRGRRKRSFSAPRRTGRSRPQLRNRSRKAGGIAERSSGACAGGASRARIVRAPAFRASDAVDHLHAVVAARAGKAARSGFEPPNAAGGAKLAGGVEERNLTAETRSTPRNAGRENGTE